MGILISLFREAQLRRGRLPRMRRLDQLPRAREGVFRIGVCSGGGELAWAPLQGDPPHLLWAGTTGSGKTRGMVLMGLQALDAGWDVEVVDFKGGGDYWVLASREAKVHVDPEDAVDALKRAADEIKARNAKMWQTPLHRVSEHDGRSIEDRAVNFADLDATVKSEHEWKPRLVLIDETASLIADRKDGGMDALRAAVQLGRSAGVHLVLGMQRPDATLLDGFIKHNIQARILSGPSDQEAEKMVLGSAVAGLADSERSAPRPPGRGIASGFGPRPSATLFQAFLLAPDRYLPHASAPDDPAGPGEAGPAPSEGGGTDSSSVSPISPTPSGLGSRSSSLLIGPSARLRLRLGALGLAVRRPRSGPFGRDPALAERCKRDAGRCQACGSPDRLEADHRRPLWAGGQDRKANLWALCHRCHRSKTRVEASVRALSRRMRGRSGYGRMRMPRVPLYLLAAGALFLVGVTWGRWAIPALIVLVVTIWWELRRPGRWLGVDGLLQSDARAERATYRGSMLGAAAATYQTTARAYARLRYGAILVSGAYLLGVYGPELAWGLLA